MAFDVYPVPQVPLQVASGATSSLISIVQRTGTSVPAGAYNKMMFIRVAMVGGTGQPTLRLKAGNGTPTAVGTSTTVILRGADPVNDYVGDAQLFVENNNVFRIRMGFDQNSNETWQLSIHNNDAASREFTWVVAESEAETAQPWIDVAPATLPYHALVNEVIQQSVQVRNKGTGPLTVTAVNPPLPAGFAVGTPLPSGVLPSGSASLTVTFTAPANPPAPDGVTSGTTTLASADTTAGTAAGHNQQVAVNATTQKLEVMLLLDASGSMSWDPLGTPLPAGSPAARWGELASAANQFLDLLAHFGEKRGKFGIARFPASDPLNPASFDIFPPADIPNVAGMAQAQAQIAAVQPAGCTPMGDGLDRVLAPATSYFATDALSVNANRRWLLLMSDGAHNCGTHNPLEFIAQPDGTAPAGTSTLDKKIQLFAVAYGIPGHTDVDHVLLKNLADHSLLGGQIREVGQPGTTPADLAKAMRDAIKTGLTPATSPLDPEAVFVIGQGEARHDVLLTQYDTRAAFVLSWNTPNPNRLRLALLTPACELITPESAGQGDLAGVTFRGTDRSHIYLVDPDFLAKPTASGRSRHGTWTFVITSPGIIDIGEERAQIEDGVTAVALDLERYQYDVLIDSTVRLQLDLDRATYFAGDPIGVSARLTAGGRPVTGASVALSTTAPARSAANFLAAAKVPADALEQAKERLSGQDATPILVKSLGAQLAGLAFEGGTRSVKQTMVDRDGVGVYTATFTATSTPELYTFYVTATGVTEEGVAFRREASLETHVLVQPDPRFTLIDVNHLGAGHAEIIVLPRDQFLNAFLANTDTAGGFGLVVRDANLAGPLVSNLDGTYTQPLTFDPGKAPAIGVQFGGKDVVEPERIAPVADLRYADRVVEFSPGPVQLANRHADPKAALGSIVDKPADRFVSLGAGGGLTVAARKFLILPHHDSDVTVFVHRDTELRSYRVEAYSIKHKQWVSLGESIGITRSFALRAAGLQRTPAIRVVDTSLRARDDVTNLPLETPGVSVSAVGFGRTTSDRDLREQVESVPDWLPWNLDEDDDE